MQKTMIVLRGVSNMGKTTTICLAYDRLEQVGKVIDRGRPSRTEVKGAILEIDGVKVGFVSQGDKAAILEEFLVPLIEKGCVAIVCATHTRGGTVEIVEQLALQAEFNIIPIDKACHQPGNHDSWNSQKADEIISEVRKAIAEAQLVQA